MWMARGRYSPNSHPLIMTKKSDTSQPAKSSTDKPVKSTSGSRLAKFSADMEIDALDQKWSERFNRLEASLITRSLEKPQEPAFQMVKVMPTHTPLVGSVKVADPFFKPTVMGRPPTSDLSGTDLPTRVTSKSTSEPARKQSKSDMDTDSDSEAFDQPELSIF